MPKESAIVRSIQRYVKASGGKCYKLHGGPQAAGRPDLIGTVSGVPFVCEVKQPGKQPTALQAYELNEWGVAGVESIVAHSVDEFKQAICGDALTLRLRDAIANAQPANGSALTGDEPEG